MLLRPRACAQFSGERGLSFGFLEANASHGSPAPWAAPAGADPSASRRSCLSPPAVPAHGVWQGERQVCNWATKEPEAASPLSTGGNGTAQHQGIPTTAPHVPMQHPDSQSLFAEAQDMLSGEKPKDGLDDWRVEILQKNKVTEHKNTSSCWPWCTWELLDFDNNFLVSYCWGVHSRYKYTVRNHFEFFARQQTTTEKQSVTDRKTGKEYLFYLAKVNLTFCTGSAPWKPSACSFPMVLGEQHRVYREKGN